MIIGRAVASWPGARGTMAPSIFRNRRIFRNFNVLSENMWTVLLLLSIKVLNFIGKSLNLAPYSTGATMPLWEKVQDDERYLGLDPSDALLISHTNFLPSLKSHLRNLLFAIATSNFDYRSNPELVL